MIMFASLALTGVALFLGYVLAAELQKIQYVSALINWTIENAGSDRVMIIASIVLFPVIFFLTSFRLVQDLREINARLQEISAGQFGHMITVKGKDELSVVAESINHLSSEWNHYLAEITQGLEKIAGGQFDHQIPEVPGNKLGEVALSINQMSMQLKHSIAEERKAEKTKNDLITGVSHDLRTPLTSILGFLEVIEEDRYQDEVEMRYYVNIAYEKSLALRRLIDELFEYTRINNGLPLELSQLDIAGLIHQLAEEFVPAMEKAGMTIRLNISEGEFKIQADGGLLVRAYENIIANAIQYGQAGKYIDIDITQDKDMLIVRIQNYGTPIPEQDLPFIFDRFYRVDSSRSKQTGGTGLGLAIAKSIVEVHGGFITARSSRTATSFETRLPVSGINQAHSSVPGEVLNESEQVTTALLEQGVTRKQRILPKKRRLYRVNFSAIFIIPILISAVVLFSVKNSFTSELLLRLKYKTENNLALMQTRTNIDSDMVIITGKTDQGYTLVIHSYFFNGHDLYVNYTMKHTNNLKFKEWQNLSLKPIFVLSSTTEQAVPGIQASDKDTRYAKHGVLVFDFTGAPPPDKFKLKVNVVGLEMSSDSDEKYMLAGDWGFEIPIEKNYRLKSNGQSEPIDISI